MNDDTEQAHHAYTERCRFAQLAMNKASERLLIERRNAEEMGDDAEVARLNARLGEVGAAQLEKYRMEIAAAKEAYDAELARISGVA